MKFKFIVFSFFVVCFLSRFTVSAADVSLVLKGGLNLAKWRGGGTQNYDNVISGIPEERKFKPGLCAGLGLGIKFNKFLALQPEFLYTRKGFKRDYKVVDQVNTVYLKLNYLELPVLLRLLIPAGTVTPNVYAGPAIATRVKIEGYTVIDGEKTDFTKQQDFAYNNNVRIFDIGLVMGGGIDIKIGPGSILIDFRYIMGLRKVWFGSNVNQNIPTEKNSVISFLLGYAIHF